MLARDGSGVPTQHIPLCCLDARQAGHPYFALHEHNSYTLYVANKPMDHVPSICSNLSMTGET